MHGSPTSTSSLLLDRQQKRAILVSDLDASSPVFSQQDIATEVIHGIGEGLDHVEEILGGLENNPDLFGTAILRKCNEFADGIGHLADEMEEHSLRQRHFLAEACQQDCMTTSEYNNNGDQNLSAISQDDWMEALNGASILLRDVESSFRAVGADEAQDIADVSLVVVRIFLMSFQSFRESIEPLKPSVQIHEWSDTESSIPKSPEKDEDEADFVERPTKRESRTSKQKERMRVLWPPLGPHIAETCEWGKEAAIKQPLLAVALGLTLWPAAIASTLISGSIVLADGTLQDAYNHFQETPLLQTVEKGAAHVYHSSRLFIVSAKFASRQTFRIVGRQVDRHGGPGQIFQHAGNVILDRALHPIETIGMVWTGLACGIGFVSDTVQVVLEQHRDQKIMEHEL
jgi:hypothetical protein